MDLESFQQHCMNKPGVSEEFPFDADTLVYKVRGKMFALTNLEPFERINLKCDPQKALELRANYSAVSPGFHMNKKHWNTIQLDGSLPDSQVREWINHSYELVVANLSKKEQENLASESN